MFRNIRISVKLILVGSVIIAIPLIAVAVLSISKATQGLTETEREQLQARALNIAQMIERVFTEEKKIALTLSTDPEIVAAARAAASRGDGAQGGTGTAAGAPDATARADARLAEIMKIQELGGSFQVLMGVGTDGFPFVASDPSYLAVNIGDRSYVKDALSGKTNIGMAALNKVTKKPFTPVAAPISVDGKVIGAMAVIVDIGFLDDLVDGEKIGETGYAFVVDGTGLAIAHPTGAFSLNIAQTPGMEEVSKRMLAGEDGVGSYVYQGVHKTAGFAHVQNTGWSVCLTEPDAEFLDYVNQIRTVVLIVGIGALVVAILVYLLFARSITRPISRGVAFAQLVAGGDFTQQLAISQRDEVGMLADALNGMSTKLRTMVGTVKESAEQVAASSEQITSSAQKLAEGAQSQASTLEQTSASVEELSASVENVAENAQSQAAAVEEGSGSMSEVQHSIEQVSKSLEDIAGLARMSVDNAQRGTDAVSEVVDGIALIAGGSEKIAGILTVIGDIADQTNLLALNASIEAARAGEHGRGFAVVADEVSKLADRSSTSTKEIESLIKESVRNVNTGVEKARGSQVAMEEIRAASQKVQDTIAALAESMSQQVGAVKELRKALDNVSEMSQSISAATEEQSSNARQVSKAVENVNEVTQSTASAAEQMSAATEQLARLAQDLQKMTLQFRVDEGAVAAGAMVPRG